MALSPGRELGKRWLSSLPPFLYLFKHSERPEPGPVTPAGEYDRPVLTELRNGTTGPSGSSINRTSSHFYYRELRSWKARSYDDCTPGLTRNAERISE